ncbi:MAG: polynucleotide adenylyltransferase [Hydrogenobaculum sp.]|nr:MAG: polynucleotide adenylyltransferase [Hydrogenobaculum sp.]
MSDIIEVFGKKHTAHGLNFYITHFDLLAKCLDREHYAFLVGGYVRDRIIGKPIDKSVDVDLITTQEPITVANRFKELLFQTYGIKADVFEFEKKEPWIKRNKIATLIFNEGSFKYRFDIAILESGGLKSFFGIRPSADEWEKILEKDLKDRDFTCNAIAVNLDDVLSVGAQQTILFDPTGGIKDLENGIIRPISYENLKKDPIRLLRGVRIANELDFDLEKGFIDFLKENHKLIKNSAKERISVEFFKLLRLKNSYKGMETLFETNAIYSIIPYLEDIKKVSNQGHHHIYPLDKHTLKVYEYADKILENDNLDIPFDKELLAFIKSQIPEYSFLGEFGTKEAIKLSALLHDIGKPHTMKIDEKGNITFYEHDKVGEELVSKISNELSFGEELSRFLQKMVRMHLRIFYLRESLENLTPRAYGKLLREAEEDIYPLMILTIADAMGSKDDEPTMKALEKTVKNIIEFKLNNVPKHIEPLLSGKEIMDILNIPEGKTVGLLKNKLLDLQYEGLIKTKEEAIEWLKKEGENINP